MQAVGIIVEYNPFHNGHQHHALEAKKAAGADVVIAVMSGQFLQRGEPALVDKWARTKMALAAGVDVVIELPYVFSTAQAKDFAKGAIYLLNNIGCSSYVFGSENGAIQPFLNTYDLIYDNKFAYEEKIKEAIQTGVSYPKALHIAYQYLKDQSPLETIDLSQPNNILGYHYVEAANNMGSSMQALTISRKGAGYHDEINEGTQIASATGIRKALFEEKNITIATPYVPATSLSILQEWVENYGTFGSWEAFWPLLKFTIIQQTPQQLTQYAEVTEGIENTLYKAAKTSDSFAQFMAKIKSKRYTWTRLQRMLTHIYTGFTKAQFQQFEYPTVVRLLGMTAKGQQYIGQQKKDITLPIVSRVAAINDAQLNLDVHATDLYALGIELHSRSAKIAKDYQMPPIRVK